MVVAIRKSVDFLADIVQAFYLSRIDAIHNLIGIPRPLIVGFCDNGKYLRLIFKRRVFI